jgi:hypothetical protein
MASIVKALEPVMKLAARSYQGALQTELNKMGEFDERQMESQSLLLSEGEKAAVVYFLLMSENFNAI